MSDKKASAASHAQTGAPRRVGKHSISLPPWLSERATAAIKEGKAEGLSELVRNALKSYLGTPTVAK